MDIVSTIISVVQGIIKYAPDAIKAFTVVKNFIAGLFGTGVITKEQQDKILAMVDAILAAHEAGPPPGWAVEPDPETPASNAVRDEGVLVQPSDPPTTDGLPPEFVAHPQMIIVKVVPSQTLGLVVCNSAGNCWVIPDPTKITKTPSVNGAEIWAVDALRFFVTAAALATVK